MLKMGRKLWRLLNRSRYLIKLIIGFRALKSASDIPKQQRARRALLQQFSDARGVTMKVGQLIAAAAAPDDELSVLTKSISPVPLKQILPAIEQALGCGWQQVFKSIDQSFAAASLGQVHHAVLLNGDEVAIKVQYPGIDEAISAEMSLLGLLPKAGPVKQWQFDLDAYRQALKDNMQAELDYRHEADTQSFFHKHLMLPGLVVPKVYADLTRQTLLVQSWEEGQYIESVAGWSQPAREKVAKTLLALLLKSLFQIRRLHADPHMGNSYYRFNAEQGVEIVLMDFGCSIELTEQQSLALLKLIIASKEKLPIAPLKYFQAMGFESQKLRHIEPYLPKLCEYLFQPFICTNKFALQQWMLAKNISELLAEQRWWFRSAGPAELIFVMRAFQGLAQQLLLVKADINWWQVLLESIPAELLNRARNFEPTDIAVTNDSGVLTLKAIARSLKVKVSHAGLTKVEVDLPAEAVLELEAFIPQDIQLKLKQTSDINLQNIQENVRRSGLAAQSVFDFEEGESRYQVWLE
ncbi:MAG: AarF/UbiB family protein [Gammaproteobacteria bacterium]|nr:AarF/UbiB family protein [Gammaproteobacteria bacterium]